MSRNRYISKDMMQAIKVAKKNAREEEIALHGKPLCWSRIVRDKTKYTRKQKHKMNYE